MVVVVANDDFVEEHIARRNRVARRDSPSSGIG